VRGAATAAARAINGPISSGVSTTTVLRRALSRKGRPGQERQPHDSDA
jgi:hypothetical protein